MVIFATRHLAPALKASEVPIGLLVLGIVCSSLGTLLMTWALERIPSLFLNFAQRKVEREMRLFVLSGICETQEIGYEELRAIHNYLWSKHCTGLGRHSRRDRMMDHFDWIYNRYWQ